MKRGSAPSSNITITPSTTKAPATGTLWTPIPDARSSEGHGPRRAAGVRIDSRLIDELEPQNHVADLPKLHSESEKSEFKVVIAFEVVPSLNSYDVLSVLSRVPLLPADHKRLSVEVYRNGDT